MHKKTPSKHPTSHIVVIGPTGLAKKLLLPMGAEDGGGGDLRKVS